VVTPADPHDHATVGDDVRHGIVFSQPNRVPHWQDIESAAEFEALRLGREPQPELNQVGQALVSLALEMVLGRPKA
jgi:hypothetical protein